MRITSVCFALFVSLAVAGPAASHCEIPCGIYGDEGRFAEIEEHVATIRKSMTQIVSLSGDPAANLNQIVRWVENKEVHADRVSQIVTQYFLTQRIKAPAGDDAGAVDAYHAKLAVLHQMMRAAMVCKQTTDVANAQKLQDLAAKFHELYAGN